MRKSISSATLVLMFLLSICVRPSFAAPYAIVEIGSKGIRAGVYDFSWDEDALAAKQHFTKSENINLISKAQDGVLPESAIIEAIGIANLYVLDIQKQFPESKIYSLLSSAYSKIKNSDELLKRLSELTKGDAELIPVDKEAYYGILASMPPNRYDQSFLVDIGSGNTKIGCLVGQRLVTAEIPYGSVSLKKEAAEKGGDFDDGLSALINEKIKGYYKKIILDTPSLANRSRIYWIGGAAWATAVYTHPERIEKSISRIFQKDITSFLDELKKKIWTSKVFSLSHAGSPQLAEKANKSLTKVKDTFTREDLLSGVGIMHSILSLSAPSSSVYFCKDGNYIYGYVLEKASSSLLK